MKRFRIRLSFLAVVVFVNSGCVSTAKYNRGMWALYNTCEKGIDHVHDAWKQKLEECESQEPSQRHKDF